MIPPERSTRTPRKSPLRRRSQRQSQVHHSEPEATTSAVDAPTQDAAPAVLTTTTANPQRPTRTPRSSPLGRRSPNQHKVEQSEPQPITSAVDASGNFVPPTATPANHQSQAQADSMLLRRQFQREFQLRQSEPQATTSAVDAQPQIPNPADPTATPANHHGPTQDNPQNLTAARQGGEVRSLAALFVRQTGELSQEIAGLEVNLRRLERAQRQLLDLCERTAVALHESVEEAKRSAKSMRLELHGSVVPARVMTALENQETATQDNLRQAGKGLNDFAAQLRTYRWQADIRRDSADQEPTNQEAETQLFMEAALDDIHCGLEDLKAVFEEPQETASLQSGFLNRLIDLGERFTGFLVDHGLDGFVATPKSRSGQAKPRAEKRRRTRGEIEAVQLGKRKRSSGPEDDVLEDELRAKRRKFIASDGLMPSWCVAS